MSVFTMTRCKSKHTKKPQLKQWRTCKVKTKCCWVCHQVQTKVKFVCKNSRILGTDWPSQMTTSIDQIWTQMTINSCYSTSHTMMISSAYFFTSSWFLWKLSYSMIDFHFSSQPVSWQVSIRQANQTTKLRSWSSGRTVWRTQISTVDRGTRNAHKVTFLLWCCCIPVTVSECWCMMTDILPHCQTKRSTKTTTEVCASTKYRSNSHSRSRWKISSTQQLSHSTTHKRTCHACL